MFKDQLLAGRRILVTGGGTGLGKSMAARFLELGAEVHICGRRKIVCDETATELMDEYGGRVVSHGIDIPDAIIAATAEHHGLRLATLNTKHFPMFPKIKRAY